MDRLLIYSNLSHPETALKHNIAVPILYIHTINLLKPRHKIYLRNIINHTLFKYPRTKINGSNSPRD